MLHRTRFKAEKEGSFPLPKFAANLSFLYQALPFLDRIAQAARDGFGAVEYVSPYEFDSGAIAQALSPPGSSQALFNLPAGDWAGGERGIGCLPDRVEEFRQGVSTAIAYARTLGCTTVNCLAGLAPAGADPAKLDRTLIDNLSYAAPRLADAGINLVIEPINRRDMPSFHLATTRPCGTHHERGEVEQSQDPVRFLSHADHARRSDADF
ncbi:hypothetical protein HA402_010927 [Bradysia odoriphaga]|nr:hypothetical protein HA402_010927 [Bradysia odoriphaga]